MIRMVNLTCPKCGMSLDTDVDHIEEFCPNCGNGLLIPVSKAVDIWNEKKSLKRKDVKYIQSVETVKPVKIKKQEKTVDIWLVIIVFMIFVTFIVMIWRILVETGLL